jgi:hypothetical protein
VPTLRGLNGAAPHAPARLRLDPAAAFAAASAREGAGFSTSLRQASPRRTASDWHPRTREAPRSSPNTLVEPLQNSIAASDCSSATKAWQHCRKGINGAPHKAALGALIASAGTAGGAVRTEGVIQARTRRASARAGCRRPLDKLRDPPCYAAAAGQSLSVAARSYMAEPKALIKPSSLQLAGGLPEAAVVKRHAASGLGETNTAALRSAASGSSAVPWLAKRRLCCAVTAGRGGQRARGAHATAACQLLFSPPLPPSIAAPLAMALHWQQVFAVTHAALAAVVRMADVCR